MGALGIILEELKGVVSVIYSSLIDDSSVYELTVQDPTINDSNLQYYNEHGFQSGVSSGLIKPSIDSNGTMAIVSILSVVWDRKSTILSP